MTEERDPKVSKRYRGLGREEPPRDLDERILAASRRTTRPNRFRWAGPLAAAAVLVLAIGVAVQVERREPELGQQVQRAPQPAAPPPAFTPDPKAQEPSREMRARPQGRAAPAPQAAPAPRMQDAPRERPADEVARREAAGDKRAAADASLNEARTKAEVASRRDAAPGDRALQSAPAAAPAKAQQSPQQWLERIAQLRSEGKDDEADRQLAEFRRAYPDYRLSDEMKAKVEKR